MVYSAPGAYVVEDDGTPMPLTGVPTGIPCFFGFTNQGPYLKPTRISSLAEFNAIFGPKVMNKTLFKHAYIADTVYGFFLNGGSTCYVCRVNGGDTVTWPVKQILRVVDYEDLASEFTRTTPAKPKYLGLTIEAASPGAWANNLLVKCTATEQSESLPMIDLEQVAIAPEDLPDAPKTVPYDRLEATGSVALPAPADLDGAEKAELTIGAVENASWAKGAAETPGTEFGSGLTNVPNSVTIGTLAFQQEQGKPELCIPVKYSPRTALDPKLLKAKFDGANEAKATGQVYGRWNAATKLRYDGVEVKNDKGEGKKTGLIGSWGEDQNFYFKNSSGDPVVLNKATIDEKANVEALKEGTLSYPLNLNKGDTLTFRVDVLEPIPPRQPGQQVTYRTLESYPGLSSVPGTANYFAAEGLVNDVSPRIRLKQGVADGKFVFGSELPEGVTGTLILPSAVGARPETKGTDRAPQPTDYIKYFPLLKQVKDVSMIACPDAYAKGERTKSFDYQPILQAMLAYCEDNQCIAVIDAPPQQPVKEIGQMNQRVANLTKFVSSYRSSYAAVYSPWLRVANTDPSDPEESKIVPPSGYMLGIYNQSDNSEGVWAAPANMSVKGPVGLNLPFTEDESEQLNPVGVNLIRAFPGQGILVWGARTTTLNVMWQYVNVRRVFLYVERTLQQQTLWAVFEPNTRRTWNILVNAAENFLRQLWLDGGLSGDTPEQAFRVSCGVPETMTQTDVDTGLLKIEIAIAPVKPAEFVVFTVSQLVQVPS